MKSVSVLSLVHAQNSLAPHTYEKFLNYYGIKIKKQEVTDLSVLLNSIVKHTDDRSLFNSFYVSFQIPQIGKEFDLLRFGEDSIINIELKSAYDKGKIESQLKRNEYYLSYLNKKIYNYCFVSETKKLYFLENDAIQKATISNLITNLHNQKVEQIDNINAKFNPSDYLVSPFNNTKKFLDNKYFLTHQQEDIKNKVLKLIEKSSEPTFMSITGAAGTGKTLLIYDIVKSIKNVGKKALIVHCGVLNVGQEDLKKEGWEIVPIKNAQNNNLHKYDVLLIDEAQRIKKEQLLNIKQEIDLLKGKCIFSYDKSQTLSYWEKVSGVDQIINGIDSLVPYKLSTKIRTNKEISEFIKSLFNKSKNYKLINRDNIEITYFRDLKSAKDYIGLIKDQGWEIIRFTPSQYDKNYYEMYAESWQASSHQIIGQEFENIAIIIDKNFSFDEKTGELIYKESTHYDTVKMLFQNITRARKKLNLIIIANDELLNRCLSILQS